MIIDEMKAGRKPSSPRRTTRRGVVRRTKTRNGPFSATSCERPGSGVENHHAKLPDGAHGFALGQTCAASNTYSPKKKQRVILSDYCRLRSKSSSPPPNRLLTVTYSGIQLMRRPLVPNYPIKKNSAVQRRECRSWPTGAINTRRSWCRNCRVRYLKCRGRNSPATAY